jgi:chromate reductase, NAD(P)H dehydrogenase (quinone)
MTTSNKNKLLFFSGSNSTNSINQKLVETLARMPQTKTVKLIDLKDFPVPLYSDTEEEKGIPPETNSLLEIIDDHNVLVIAVPQHNHSMPAFFKNTIDWMSRARTDYRIFKNKDIILLSATPGNGNDNIILNARIVLEALGANVIGAAILNEFYKQTVNENEQIQITSTSFLSEFENLLAATTAL